MRLLVTTTPDPPAALVARARAVAVRCGAKYVVRRGSVARMCRDTGHDVAYVVRRTREELRAADVSLHVHPGLFYLKREAGATHPLIRALAPALGAPVATVVDATLGLAGDALFVATQLAVDVLGIEASPVLASLLEEGLPRLAAEDGAWSAGAARVTLRHGDALDVLRTLPDGAADVVYLDPMFETPLGAQAGFDLLRLFAEDAALSPELLREAWRVAARRVVLKVAGTVTPPGFSAGPGWNRRVRGQAVDYLVLEGELTDPEYEAPTLGDPADARR